jgi:predicted NBD/HSP70 family sugar kinase
MAPRKSSLTPVKTAHLVAILQLIHSHPGISKPEICDHTGLMPSTVHTSVAHLLADKLVVCQGTAASRGGRRANQYQLAPDIGCVGSISIRLNYLEVGIFNLSLEPLVREEISLAMTQFGPETYTSKAVQLLESCMEKISLPREKVLGVGVTLPGPVDFRTGVVQQLCRAPKWQQFPIAERMRQSLGCPVVVDKDAYAVLDLLSQTGKVKNTDCCAYLAICEGIGSALMINGQVFRGGHSLAGEIGHLTVRKNGHPCPCGNTGCLELYCSDIGIVQQYNSQTDSKLTSVSEVVALAEKNDPVASDILSQAIGYLVDTTSTMIMTYDPKELLIFCTWLRDQRALYFWMLDTLYAKSIFTQKHAVQIRLTEEDPLNLNAAAALAVRNVLQEALVSPS